MKRFSKIILPVIFILIACSMLLTSCNGFVAWESMGSNDKNDNSSSSTKGNTKTTAKKDPDKEAPEYSQLLQNVLTNDYYNSLIDIVQSGNYDFLQSGKFQPHPYTFLQNEGFDVNAIKNKQIDCYTMSYVLEEEPNNLYMFTRVTVEGIVYNYLLMYELTDQEMKDYDMTHDDPRSATNYYVQAVFMNNEISKMKTPTVIGTSKMTVKAFDKMTESMGTTKCVETASCEICMINPVQENYTFDLLVWPRFYESEQMAFDSSVVYLVCRADMSFENGAYSRPYSYGIFGAYSKLLKDARIYLTQRGDLNLARCKDLNANN